MKNITMKVIGIILAAMVFGGTSELFPCTVAVVSGKATHDGRPLLWKNRDTSSLDNKIMYFKGTKYSFVGLIDTRDKAGVRVWAGINTEGFAIMNSASGDLTEQSNKSNIGNGRLMKIALGECANAADFEELLRRTEGKRSVAANFGIIDAEGNACFYETSNTRHEKFDANDPRIAPFGYIIRTNYAFTAPVKYKGGGYIRFERASHLFETACAEGRLNLRFIIRQASRDLVNEKLHSFPLSKPRTLDSSKPLYINTNDTINRNSTASVAVFHGVSSRDKTYLATMWVLLGQPVSTTAVPLWAAVPDIPQVLSGAESAPLNSFSRALISFLYPDKRGHMRQYLNISRLKHYRGKGVLAMLYKIENKVFGKTNQKLQKWELKKPSAKEMSEFENDISTWVFEALQKAFPNIK